MWILRRMNKRSWMEWKTDEGQLKDIYGQRKD